MAGLLTATADSPTVRVLDAMLAGHVAFLLSVPLLAEYRDVLLRPRIRKRHGLAESEVDAILTRIAVHGVLRELPDRAPPAPDPGDDHLRALLAAVGGAVLVTGDAPLLADPPAGRSVLSPRSYLQLLALG